MERKTRPWWHYLLGCGCLCLVLAGLSLLIGGSYLYKVFKDHVFQDSARVDAMVAEMLPGAKPFKNYDGRYGMVLGRQKLAIFSPPRKGKGFKSWSQPGDFQMAFESNESSVTSVETVRGGMLSDAGPGDGTAATPAAAPARPTNKESVVKSENVTLMVGGKPFPAEKVVGQDQNAGKAHWLHYLIGFRKGPGSVFIMTTSQAEGMDMDSFQTFLSGIDASSLTPLEGVARGASPAPAARTPAPK